jgi:hypothetical protein
MDSRRRIEVEECGTNERCQELEDICRAGPRSTDKRCGNIWYDALVFKIEPATARAGQWTAAEDKKLQDAVPTNGVKNWKTIIAAIVPGRTIAQCRTRLHDAADSKSYPSTARVGKWAAFEDDQLKNAVRVQGGTNWEAVAALVLGRMKKKHSVAVDGMMPWSPKSTQRRHVRVNMDTIRR